MGLFRRRPKPDAPSGNAEGPDPPGPRTVHERIEVTVEREWVSMVVKNPPAAFTVEAVRADVEVEAERVLKAPESEISQGD